MASAWASLAGVLLLANAGTAAERVEVVRDGKPVAVLVVDTTEGARVRRVATAELREHVFAMTGARLSVVRHDKWKPGSGPAIIVGKGAATKALGLDVGKLPREGYRLVALPARQVIVLAGDDSGNPLHTAAMANRAQSFGSLYAAYDLLERWGVRWLFPGEMGAVIPKTKSLSLGAVDVRRGPAFSMRNLWQRPPASTRVRFRDAVRVKARKRNAAQRLAVECRLWSLRQRCGNSDDRYHTRHHRPGWASLWAETHPEYLGLYRGLRGWRRMPVDARLKIFHRSKLNVGHPEAAKALAQLAIAAFKKTPTRASYSICEQDGSGGFDESDASTALDTPNPITYAARGKGIYAPYGRNAYTDRYIHFWNRVAEIVAKECPGKYLGVYAYSVYRHLPRREKRLHPALRVIYCNNGETHYERLERMLAGWTRLSAHPIGTYYPVMTDAWGSNPYGFPWAGLRNVRRGLQLCRKLGVLGFRGAPHFRWANVASHGLMMYATARMHWNPDLTPKEILGDYTQAAYGGGAREAAAYFAALEEAHDRRPLPHPSKTRAGLDNPIIDHALAVFTPQFVASQLARLDAARSKARTPEQRARVDLLRESLRLAGLQTEALRAWNVFERTGRGIEAVIHRGQAVERFAAKLHSHTQPPVAYRRSGAAVAVELAKRYRVIRVLEPTGWRMRPDPYQEGVTQRWFAPGREDGDWRPINQRLGYDLTGLHGSDVVVWCRKAFVAPQGMGRKAMLGFRVRGTSAEIYMNGKRIALQAPNEKPAYRMPFVVDVAGAKAPAVYDVTGVLRPGERNELVVRLWGYTDRGVAIKPVWLLGEK